MMAHMSKSNGSKQLVRTFDGRGSRSVLGIAGCHDIDVNLVRLVFVVASFFGFIGVLAYLAAWVILPEEALPRPLPRTCSIRRETANRSRAATPGCARR